MTYRKGIAHAIRPIAASLSAAAALFPLQSSGREKIQLRERNRRPLRGPGPEFYRYATALGPLARLGLILVLGALAAPWPAAFASRTSGARGPGRQATTLPTPTSTGASAAQATESKAERDARMRWWREARFGMFIHWGIYAVPAGEFHGQRPNCTGEWIMSCADIPRSEYEKFALQFEPVKFDADQWVSIARNAGMKYIVITSKHHDGFAMFGSKVSKYNIMDATPFHRDPLKELSAAARKQGIRFGVYYSIMDWHHPSQYVDAPGKDPTAGNNVTKIKPDQKASYIDYMKGQLREVVAECDPDVLWFDGQWPDWWTEADGAELYSYVRGLKPSIVINNRVGKGRNSDQQEAGDFGTPEQRIPAQGLPGVDWESCMTMNDTWGYKSFDDHWKSADTILKNLIDIASKGGNYLLNVGPTAEGVIPEPSVERLQEVGKWLKVNGEAIYGTTASPFPAGLSFGRATQKPGRVYLEVFDWPKDGKLAVPALNSKVKRAYLLVKPNKPLQMHEGQSGITIDVPAAPVDPVASVVVLETTGR